VAAGEVVELGEILLGTRPGRQAPSEITIAKLTGLAAQDVFAAEQVLG
jgi:ornithine cyclodeaminase/alanine dehydrogenase-like protein (mu-crystallin family)